MLASDYQNALLALLPTGEAWVSEPDGELAKLMLALGEEFARIDARAVQLLAESVPSGADDLLEEWEADYGLPDSCSASSQTEEERKLALVQKYRLYGSQSRVFLIEMAAVLGIDITITEYHHRVFGDPFGEPWVGQGWNFVIQVNIEGAPAPELQERLECVFSKIVHAHKALLFTTA
jgi:uncharacterized protein YmfQ (DUF2313 family)